MNTTDLKKKIENDGFYILKNIFTEAHIDEIIQYLIGIMRGSLPSYKPLSRNSDNFYRINFNDERSTIKGHFVQFNFFPWNQDFIDLFNNFGQLFEIRNKIDELITGIKKHNLSEIDKDLIKRIAVQFYPSGKGYMQAHSDPIGMHQIVVVSVVMSNFGSSYNAGGLFVNKGGIKIYPEHKANKGDVIIFRGDLPHGVDTIDPHLTGAVNPFNGAGRWMMLSAITKPSLSDVLENAKPIY